MRPVLVTAPATLPVALADMKAHLRVDHDDENDLITAYTTAATAYLDGWGGILGRCIIGQQWSVTLSEMPRDGRISLPLPDVSAVTVEYIADGTTATLSAATYRLQEDAGGSWIEQVEAASWPLTDARADAVTITMTAAMPAADLPRVKTAIKLLVGHWYENREAVTVGQPASDVPMAFDALVAPMRRVAM
jgi:uncharacterized phiE125 gp8 family phage protein